MRRGRQTDRKEQAHREDAVAHPQRPVDELGEETHRHDYEKQYQEKPRWPVNGAQFRLK